MIIFIPIVLFSISNFNKADTIWHCSNYYQVNDKIYDLLDNEIYSVDVGTFKCIEYEYAKDKNAVYFSGKKNSLANPQTFKVLQYGFSKDSLYVFYNYYSQKTIKRVDSKSFKVIDYNFSKDKNHVYYFDLKKIFILKNLDSESFEKICDFYYKDKNNYYDFEGKVITKDLVIEFCNL